MKNILIILFVLCFGICLSLNAQNTVPASVFGNGGSPAFNGTNVIIGTLGQQAIGISQSSSETVYAGFWNAVMFKLTAVDEKPGDNISSGFGLVQNYPNPFSGKTRINFEIGQDSEINLSIYNMLGEHICTLADGRKQAGNYSVDWDGSNFFSGTFFCRLTVDNHSVSSIINLIK
ncbi:MAG: T9SS type A sorting domain-containing protein [Ignavibacteriae bacterium]|nr:T9SS type A sorting domain-containing protein [Ignavibacteriota bacterium]